MRCCDLEPAKASGGSRNCTAFPLFARRGIASRIDEIVETVQIPTELLLLFLDENRSFSSVLLAGERAKNDDDEF